MALGDFFRINMPYGMKRNNDGEWMVFNREYKPLGWNTIEHIDHKEYPVFTKYKGLTETKLLKLTCSIEDSIRRDENEKIDMIWFYDDGTTPTSSTKHWNAYNEKMKLLSKIKAVSHVY